MMPEHGKSAQETEGSARKALRALVVEDSIEDTEPLVSELRRGDEISFERGLREA
jgi:hypothetical protein